MDLTLVVAPVPKTALISCLCHIHFNVTIMTIISMLCLFK